MMLFLFSFTSVLGVLTRKGLTDTAILTLRMISVKYMDAKGIIAC
jgi:hypothetical protein